MPGGGGGGEMGDGQFDPSTFIGKLVHAGILVAKGKGRPMGTSITACRSPVGRGRGCFSAYLRLRSFLNAEGVEKPPALHPQGYCRPSCSKQAGILIPMSLSLPMGKGRPM